MLKNILYLFDLIYKLFKLQFCIVLSLIIGLFIFTIGPTLYASSAIINELVIKENTSVVRSYFKHFLNGFRATSVVGIIYIIFIISSILFAYNIRILLDESVLSLLSNIYYLLVLLAVISLYILTSILRDYKLSTIEAVKQSLKIMLKVPFVPLFLTIWTIASSIMFSAVFGLYVVMGPAVYFGGVFLIINMFLKENEESTKR